jgi:hypothetical protein
VVDPPLVMSCVEPSVKVPTAWNWTVGWGAGGLTSGTAVTIWAVQAVSIGVGAALPVEAGVGEGGGPGQSEIACKNGPAGEATAQAVIGTPPG